MTQRFRIFRGKEEWLLGAGNRPSVDALYDAARSGVQPTAGWGSNFASAIEEARMWSRSSLRWVDTAISSEVHDTVTGKIYEVNAGHPGYREIRRL